MQNTQVEDEELFEKLNAAVSNETERMQKLGSHHDQPTNRTPTQLVAQLATHADSHGSVEGKTPEKPPKVNLLTEVRELNWLLSGRVWNNKAALAPNHSTTL